jgi:hypothetical protein
MACGAASGSVTDSHFAQFHGGSAEVFAAEDIGDTFDHVAVSEVAVSEKLAGVAVEDFDQRRQVPPDPAQTRSYVARTRP